MSDFKSIPISEQLEYIRKGAVEIIREEELVEKLKRAQKTGKPLRVKAGFDPTAPDIHLGHTVLIRKMKHFQDLGHTAIFLIGDFTGLIGDPSGRNVTRKQLTQGRGSRQNAETYKQQIFKILNPEDNRHRFQQPLDVRAWRRRIHPTRIALHRRANSRTRRLLEPHEEPAADRDA